MMLSKIQSQFKDFILQPLSNIDGGSDDLNEIFEGGDIDISERLKIYHNNIVGSISEALCSGFPILENLIGREFLKIMALEFIFENPPTSGCLHYYGAGFDEFILNYGNISQRIPYLPDIAKLEIAMNNAYYARDDEALLIGDIQGVSPKNLENLKINLRASAGLISSKFPLLQIRDYCVSDGQGDMPDLASDALYNVMVCRPNLEVVIIPLEEDEHMFLSLLDGGRSLDKVVDMTLTRYSDFDFASFLQKHISIETFLVN